MSPNSPNAPHGADAQIEQPFSQSWIQALTLVADNPLAKTIKPRLEWVNTLSRARGAEQRDEAAQGLWDFATSEGLLELLGILPIGQSRWVFDSQDPFLYQTADSSSSSSSPKPDATAAAPRLTAEVWRQQLGLEPITVSLVAEVYGGDWASLVRSEAVRLQQSFNMSAVGQATTLRLPCTARWDCQAWSVQFDQVDWVVVNYEDIPVVPRPAWCRLEEQLTWLMATANDALVSKKATACERTATAEPWQANVESLSELHAMLRKNRGDFSPWFQRTWNCVWPIVYREQGVLRERADIAQVRRELKACLESQPRLCLWMFVFAKLVCQTQLSTGLGVCADFGD